MHFHRDILANADTFPPYVLEPEADDVFIGTPPIAFTFGLGGLVIFPLRVGASTIMVEKATPEQLADLIQEHGATVCFTAPTAYKAMRAQGRASSLTGLRRAVSAGEHLARSTWEEFHEATGLKLIDGIGSTEMLHIFIGFGRRHPARLDRAASARLPGQGRRQGRAGRLRRRRRQARGQGVRPGAATWPTSGRPSTSRTGGTSRATPSSGTRTATSGTRPARTT